MIVVIFTAVQMVCTAEVSVRYYIETALCASVSLVPTLRTSFFSKYLSTLHTSFLSQYEQYAPLSLPQLNSGRVQRFCSEVGWSPLERLVNDFKVMG